jgi:hypothetical protein
MKRAEEDIVSGKLFGVSFHLTGKDTIYLVVVASAFAVICFLFYKHGEATQALIGTHMQISREKAEAHEATVRQLREDFQRHLRR